MRVQKAKKSGANKGCV